MRLIDRLFATQQDQIEAAWDDYVALLEANSDDAKAVSRLQAVMDRIGRTPEQVRSDAQIIADVRRLQRVIHDGTGIEQQCAKAQQAVEDSMQAMNQKIRELRLAHQQVVFKARELGERYVEAQKAAHGLDDLRKQEPQIVSRLNP